MFFLIAIMIGYVFGCINGSQIIGKIKQINIKKSGMKNAGATNTTYLLGWKYGIIVAFIDIVKAIVSLAILALLLEQFHVLPELKAVLLFINALFVVIGHNYPLTMGFSGGK